MENTVHYKSMTGAGTESCSRAYRGLKKAIIHASALHITKSKCRDMSLVSATNASLSNQQHFSNIQPLLRGE